MALAITTGIWGPQNLTGLKAWYKADTRVYNNAGTTLATDGQTVQQWNDQSGNGYHLKQATSGKRPTYRTTGLNSRPTLEFVAASVQALWTDAEAVAMPSSCPTISVFAVAQLHSAALSGGRLVSFKATGRSWDYATTDSFCFERNGTTEALQFTANGGVFSFAAITYNTNYRFGAIVDAAADVTRYLNNSGTLSADASAWDFGGTSNAGTLGVGDSPPGADTAGSVWDGYISEVIICSAELTAAERQSLDNYLKVKWGF